MKFPVCELDDQEQLIHHPYCLGSGLHYINDHFQVFPDGSYKLGDTSEPLIIVNLHRLCSSAGLPPVWDLWNSVYPEERMTLDSMATWLGPFMGECEWQPPLEPANVRLLLKDLRSCGHERLASEVVKRLPTAPTEP